MTDSGSEVSARILDAWEDYHELFRDFARRARYLFGQRAWRDIQENARRRLLLYTAVIDPLLEELRDGLGTRAGDSDLWAEARDAFRSLTLAREDGEVARTFFNSVSRRAQGTVGIRPRTEFVGDEAIPSIDRGDPGRAPSGKALRLLRFEISGSLDTSFEAVFEKLARAVPLVDAASDARLAADAVQRDLSDADSGRLPEIEALEFVPGLFFRNKTAYMVGRILHLGADGPPTSPAGRDASLAAPCTPLVLPLRHDEEGVRVDAVLTHSDEVSVVFGFSRSYFKADIEPEAGGPRAVVAFLATLMPGRREDELFTSLGYNRHRNRYRLVFLHDRVGRLADAQQFEGLEFPASAFEPEVLEELLSEAGASVRLADGRVTVDQAWSERRMTPLDVHLARAEAAGDVAAERAAILDYGLAVKDLAAAGIFPGDLLLKNFGVTRHGRVIFYDYDELTLLTECNFRDFPRAIHDEDELRPEPWYYVAESDVFPEEFPKFIRIPPDVRDEFMERHGEIFTAAWWREMQALSRAGEIADFHPYPSSRRLNRAGP
ncbi:MAG: bifunctional isocitrate dehydrogenase kinase/phosphatase [Gemmatimonadota bacterium]